MKIDVDFYKPFVQATVKSFDIQCSMAIRPSKPFFKGRAEQPKFGIAAVIGITCPSFNGSITLCFPKDLFLKLIKKMTDEEFDSITDEVADGAAELLNIVYGNAKAMLNQKGYNIGRSIPTIIRGEGVQSHHVTTSKTIVLPFITEFGEFHIEFATEALIEQ